MVPPLISPEHSRALDYVANQETKAFTYIVLNSLGIATVNQISEELDYLSGENASRQSKTYPRTFEKFGFAEHITDVGRNGRPAQFFSTSDTEIALPVIGSMLSWSDQHDDYSLTRVVSISASKGSAAPTNSVQIINGLLNGFSLGEIDFPRYRRSKEGWSTAHNTRLRTMVSDGLILVEDDPNEYQVDNPVYRGSKPFHKLSDATQASYKILQLAKDMDSDKKWTTPELVNLALEHRYVTQEKATELHYILDREASLSTPKYAPGAIRKIVFQPRKYGISPTFEPVASNLIDHVALLQTEDQKKLNQLADKAIALLQDGTIIKKLVKKAIDDSPYINN